MSQRLKTELKWLLGGFGLPFLVLIAFDLFFSSSKLSVFERLCRFEDVCSYGACFFIPLLVYGLALTVRMVLTKTAKKK